MPSLLPLSLLCLNSFVASQNYFWQRDLSGYDAAAPATVSGVATAGYTSGAKAVTTQLKTDANAAIEAFAAAVPTSTGNTTTQSTAETAQLFNTIVKGAISYPINQSPGTSSTPSQDRLNAMASVINATLNSVNDVADKILSSSNGALHYSDLKDCINGLVQQGGLHTGESCTINGMSITGVSDLMTSVLNTFGDGAIPASIITQATKALDPTFTAIIPGEQEFYDAVNDAFTSVQASVSGELVAALNDAQNCFEKAMAQSGTYDEKMAYTQSCNRSPTGSSVYNDLKTLYLSVTNQMVGYLPAHIIDSIHEISDHYLDENDTTSDAAYFRSAIANTTASIVASNSGNQVTYAYSLANCLDSLVGTTDPQAAANIAKTKGCLSQPDGPSASLKEIVYGYIQQIYGVLPAQIAAKIEASGVADLDPSASDYQSKVEELHQTFLKTDPGPQYVTCYETFVDCLFNTNNGALEHPSSTQSVCLLGDACKATPDGQANPTVTIGKRALAKHLALLNRRISTEAPTRTSRAQRHNFARDYHITTPRKSYLLHSINGAIA